VAAMGAAALNGLLAPESGGGIRWVKSAKSVGVITGTVAEEPEALMGEPDAATTKLMRDRAIYSVLLVCDRPIIRGEQS